MIKWLVCTFLAHVIMPFIATAMSLFLIEYWSYTLFNLSILEMVNEGYSPARIFYGVFLLLHIWFAFQWWFFSDLKGEKNG